MKFKVIDPPRAFKVGSGGHITLKDCAHVELAADEQVTLKTESGGELDVCRKAWGFYATPSLNRRLLSFGLMAVLMKSHTGQFFVLLVERGKEALFEEYLQRENARLICRLDDSEFLERLGELYSQFQSGIR